jgi:hypothetical protein
VLLRIWRDVPFPGWLRRRFLRMLNPSFMAGAMALIQDDQGRMLILEHTSRTAPQPARPAAQGAGFRLSLRY